VETVLTDPNTANKGDLHPFVLAGSAQPSPTLCFSANQSRYSLRPAASLKPTERADRALRRL
jgi:hypothetical protein